MRLWRIVCAHKMSAPPPFPPHAAQAHTDTHKTHANPKRESSHGEPDSGTVKAQRLKERHLGRKVSQDLMLMSPALGVCIQDIGQAGLALTQPTSPG